MSGAKVRVTPAEPEANVHCPACDARLDPRSGFHGVDRLHGTPGDFEVRCCEACGTGVTLPFATPAQLSAFYPREYGPYDDALGVVTGTISRVIRWWQSRRALAAAPLRSLRDLPIGRRGRRRLRSRRPGRPPRPAGLARDWDRAVGQCLPGGASIAGSMLGRARWPTSSLESGTYDAAIFRHSLEHTSDPSRDLATVLRALGPGGLVLVTVPNFACWQRRRFGDCWYHLDLPRHRIHFTPRGLSAALERAGAEVGSLTTSTSTVGLPATVQYRLFGRCLFPSGLALRIASGLCVLFLPVAWILDRAHGGGDQLHVVAKRPG